MAAVRAVKMRIALSSPRKEGMNSRDVAELELTEFGYGSDIVEKE